MNPALNSQHEAQHLLLSCWIQQGATRPRLWHAPANQQPAELPLQPGLLTCLILLQPLEVLGGHQMSACQGRLRHSRLRVVASEESLWPLGFRLYLFTPWFIYQQCYCDTGQPICPCQALAPVCTEEVLIGAEFHPRSLKIYFYFMCVKCSPACAFVHHVQASRGQKRMLGTMNLIIDGCDHLTWGLEPEHRSSAVAAESFTFSVQALGAEFL